MDANAVRAMMEEVAAHVIANVDVLSEADRATGDGDHGIGMRRGFEAARDVLAKGGHETPEAVMKAAGMAIMSNTGGAAGAVFGTLFRAGAKAFEGRETIGATEFADFLASALEAVKKRGGVVEGQKTMVDALAPAAAAASTAQADLSACLGAAAAAARQGVEATKDMLATTGKARSLGERSLGHVDPGAVSVSLILEAMHRYARQN